MKNLSLATGIGSDANFLNGDIVDNQTLINEFVNQDLIQFFQKLADLASISFNDLFDNETNSYQLLEALEFVVRSYAASDTELGTAERAIQGEIDAGTDTERFIVSSILRATTFIAAQIPVLDTGKITTGVFTTARLPVASNILAGVLETATDPEAQAGAAINNKFLTPENLVGHEAWTTSTITNADMSLSAADPLRYKRLNDDQVELTGRFVVDNPIITTGQVIATMPSTHRPTDQVMFTIYDPAAGNDFQQSGYVLSTGVVVVSNTIIAGTYAIHVTYLTQ